MNASTLSTEDPQIQASAQTIKNLYSKIASGMTYQKVVAILGKQGSEGARSEVNGTNGTLVKSGAIPQSTL